MFAADSATFIPDGLKSHIGRDRCWIVRSRTIELIYVYIPIGLILVLNIFFYSITAYKIYQVRKETSIVANEDNRHSKADLDKARLVFFSILKSLRQT